jgi:hypothetical protein
MCVCALITRRINKTAPSRTRAHHDGQDLRIDININISLQQPGGEGERGGGGGVPHNAVYFQHH